MDIRLGSRASASLWLLISLLAGCDESSGRGLSALIRTSAEVPGTNCSAGGVRIEVGVDANRSGVLELPEIDAAQTRFVCNGAEGVAGPAGAAGATGPAGVQGVQGEPGPQGERGLPGAQGPEGERGPVGAQGPAGVAGPVGPAGPAGPAGAAGPQGLTWRGAWDAGTYYDPGDVVTDGASSFVAVVAALAGQDPASSPSAWELLASGGQRGEAGATGPAGPQGPEGAAGPQGPAGAAGPPGATGPEGAPAVIRTQAEPPGANCATGGVKMEAGNDANRNGALDTSEVNAVLTRYVCNGFQGPQGIQGPQGPQGPQGWIGPQGPSGPPGPGTTAFGTDTNHANPGVPGATECMLGTVFLTAGDVGPGGMLADGRLLPIAHYQPLFALLGTRYGGDGWTNFALPNLTNAAPNDLSYVICTVGSFPVRD